MAMSQIQARIKRNILLQIWHKSLFDIKVSNYKVLTLLNEFLTQDEQVQIRGL